MWVTHKQEHQTYSLWALWVISLGETHITHNWRFFGKGLGTLWQSVGNVGNLPIRFKSLAYNIRAKTIYKIQFLAIYPFYITPNTHNQAGSGSQVHAYYPHHYPQATPQLPPKHSKHQNPINAHKILYD